MKQNGPKKEETEEEVKGDNPYQQSNKRLYRPAELIAKFYRYIGLLPQKTTAQVKKNN